MKRITLGITGASGILGSKLCAILLENGYNLHVLTRNTNNFKKSSKIKVFKIDLLKPDKQKLIDFLKDIQFLFHLASELNNESLMMKTNYNGTKLLVDYIKNKNIPLFTYQVSVFLTFLKQNMLVKIAIKSN